MSRPRPPSAGCRLHTTRSLTKQESSLLDDYMNALMDTNDHEYRYLYVQGIKDSIRFFVKLGMLH